MADIWEKVKSILTGNLNSCLINLLQLYLCMALLIAVLAAPLDCKCDDIAAAKSSAILAAVEDMEEVDSWKGNGN